MINDPVEIRGHNLLCIQGFVGKGYSPDFVDNMRRTIDVLTPATVIKVICEPDQLCNACPNLAESGCALHGEGTEVEIAVQDRDVMARLGITEGEHLRWTAILERIRATVAPEDLESICGNCPWLPLGVCADGLRRLREG